MAPPGRATFSLSSGLEKWLGFIADYRVSAGESDSRSTFRLSRTLP